MIAAVVVAAVMTAVRPLSTLLHHLFGAAAGKMGEASLGLAALPPGEAGPASAPPPLEREQDEDDQDHDRAGRGGTPGPITSPTGSGSAGGGAGATSGESGSGNRGGGLGNASVGGQTSSSGGGQGSGGGGGGAVGGIGPGTVAASPGIEARDPTAAERRVIDAARNILLASSVTFSLFDFTTGAMATQAVAQVVNEVGLHGVPLLMADLSSIGALAAVFSSRNSDRTFDRSKPVYLVFDVKQLAIKTKEIVAAILEHESWHVHQLFSGIMDDFIHYPRTVDIEYEAFVAGAAVWDSVKGSQTDRTLDAGSACVAQGEARCKEILALGFGYSVAPRKPS